MDQIDLDLLELEEKEADCLFTFTDLNGVLKTPATMTWADIGINTEVRYSFPLVGNQKRGI